MVRKNDLINPKATTRTRTRKKCEYSGCKTTFLGIKIRKYCDEHLKPKYRNEKYYKKYKEQEKEIEKIEKKNQLRLNHIIRHSMKKEYNVIFHCDCCGEPFDVLILPRTEIYPRFCPIHRNEYQRKRYKSKNNS